MIAQLSPSTRQGWLKAAEGIMWRRFAYRISDRGDVAAGARITLYNTFSNVYTQDNEKIFAGKLSVAVWLHSRLHVCFLT